MRRGADSERASGHGGSPVGKDTAGQERSRRMAAGEAGGVGRAQRGGEP
jgi:hypothetical protein